MGEYKTARARKSRSGETISNKCDQQPAITYAMFEMSIASDCIVIKKRWQRYGFKDITPFAKRKWYKKKKVPSFFNSGHRDLWKQRAGKVRSKLAEVNADWYMLSGHHGGLYYNMGAENLLWTGFFNNDYCSGRYKESEPPEIPLAAIIENSLAANDSVEELNDKWTWDFSQYRRKKKRKKMRRHKNYELFFSTGHEPRTKDIEELNIEELNIDNPLLEPSMKAQRSEKCKGLILSACNTLSYVSVRKTWQDYYPNAVLIGTFGGTDGGKGKFTNAIRASIFTKRSFWEDPKEVLEKVGPERFTKELGKHYKYHGIGIVYKKICYASIKRGKRKRRFVENPYDKEVSYLSY